MAGIPGTLIDRALFRVYQTQEQLAAAGITVPSYRPDRKLKHWADPNPVADDEGNAVYQVLAQTADGTPKLNAAKQPYLVTIRIPVEEARAYNIPAPLTNSGYPITGPGAVTEEWLVPIKGPADDEEWTLQGLGGLPRIVKKTEAPPTGEPAATTPQLNALAARLDALAARLEDIAAKLDLLLAR